MADDKPEWLKIMVSADAAAVARRVDAALTRHQVHTVCRSARCPNLPTCWGHGTATFMILGDVCTRSCRFCAVSHGCPLPPDPGESERLTDLVVELGLRYTVLTSVDRDDLPDGGATHYAQAIGNVRCRAPRAIVEALIPDFAGDRDALKTVLAVKPHVVGHNLETVRRLTPDVRDRRAGYDLSLSVLGALKEMSPDLVTKSSLLLGLGETDDEVGEALGDLREVGTDVVVLGQYLRPTPRQLPVKRYVPPDEFRLWEERAGRLGFRAVVSTPLARTSFRAADAYALLR